MKKRVFGLDFIRAIATILIVITHFNARYIWIGTPEAYNKMIIGAQTFNIYIGALGVSLFFVISGAALMMTYENNFELKTFLKKRFLTIYPMFWIAYFVAFLHQFYRYRCINQSIPKINIILSVLGMDGYLSNFKVPTFYLLGEWFLGFIIIVYILFPILRWGVLKHPVLMGIVAVILYGGTIYFYKLEYPSSIILFIRLPEILFGMYFQKYFKRVDMKVAIMSSIVLIINTIFAPQISSDIQTTYIGISAFLVLYYISNYFENQRWLTCLCKVVCKYSYAVFLIHHYIIAYLMEMYDLNNITVLESWILFVLICCLVALFSYLLYFLNQRVMEVVYLMKDRKEG